MKYEAFISYRHREIDEVVAKHVQKIIERYRVPGKIAKAIGKTHVGKVFRDSDELQAASNLSEIIRTGIENSEWLIVICTRRYKDSVWCMEEIEHFIELNGREKVIVILVEGEPNESFPSILTEIEVDGETKHIEPLAVDIRGDSEKAIIKNLNNEQFRFLSTILQVDYDDLKNRQRERRIRRIATAATFAFAILATITGLIIKNNIDLYNSNQKTLRGESYFLAEYADAAYKGGDRDTAVKLALTALPGDLDKPDRPYVANAMKSLTDALGIYDYAAGYHVGYIKNMENTTWNSYTYFSEDESTMLIESVIQTGNTQFMRLAQVVRVLDGETLYEVREADIYANPGGTNYNGALLSRDGKKLFYLNEEYSLVCVDIESGKELFAKKQEQPKESNMLITMDPYAEPGRTAIVTLNGNDLLTGYDLDGNRTVSVDLSDDDSGHELGRIDHKSGRIAVSTVRTSGDSVFGGFRVIDLKTGDSTFYVTQTLVCNPAFTGDDLVTYPGYDSDGNLCLYQYDMKARKQTLFSQINPDNYEISVNDKGKCYYFDGNMLYGMDCTADKEPIWEKQLPAKITSVCSGGGMIAAALENGSVYVFEEDGKKQINTPESNGESIRAGCVSRTAYTTKDSHGNSIRVYLQHGDDYYKDAKKGTITGIGDGSISKWFNLPTHCDRFIFGTYNEEGRSWLAEYDAYTLERISVIEPTDIGGSGFVEQFSNDYIIFDNGETAYHFEADTMKEVYKGENYNSKRIYREDGKTMYESTANITENGEIPLSGNIIRTIECATGKMLEESVLPDGAYYGAKVGDRLLIQTDNGVLVEGADGKTDTFEDYYLHYINEERRLAFLSTADAWHVYSVDGNNFLLEKPINSMINIYFFGNNRYVLIDYSEVYDMDTWEKVLTLKPENGNPIEAYTNDSIPYYIIGCQSVEENSYGNNIACLYEKGESGELVEVIDNFIAMAPDGEVIVYDGEETLYKFPLLSPAEIKKKGEQMTGGAELTPEQKEKYHIFR